METPSSTQRVTRSQTLASSNNSNITFSKGNKEESEKSVSKTRATNGKQQNERAALIDITNDSPIVGLAMETPSSAVGKQRGSRAKPKSMLMTPGSGEALLRGQVKTLLQKVEEEAELSKVESRPFLGFQGCVDPIPANTPQLSNLCEDGGLGSIVIALPIVEEQYRTSESLKSVITRSLLLDFSEDSLESYSEDQGKSSACKEKESSDEDEEDIEELCEGLSKISMEEKFRGRHTRFVYNSDDEIEREEGEAMRLKGLPTPKGKHLRFPIEEEDDA